jgi:hypothetical protein
MTGTQKTVGWVLFAIVVLVLIMASMSDHGIGEGHRGSYLGRDVPSQEADARALGARTATQRF